LDVLGGNDITNLRRKGLKIRGGTRGKDFTFCLNFSRVAGVKVSAFAITGIRFTLEPNNFIVSTSNGVNLVKYNI
jgi:hypothetical protein